MKKTKLGMRAGRPSKTKTATTLSELADKAGTVRVNFDLDRAEHVKLKVHAARTGRSVAEVLRELVDGIDEKRVPKTYRLHPDRLAELDAISAKSQSSKAAVIEELIQAAHDFQLCDLEK